MKRVRDGWDANYIYYDGERELLECGPAGRAAFRNVYGKGIERSGVLRARSRGV